MYFRIHILGLFILTWICSQTQGNRKCYYAKTCIHDGQEKCGEDEEGNLRRFIDSCDLKEYNCLKGTDYKKTSLDNCQALPPLEDVLSHTEPTSIEKKQNLNKPSEEKDGELTQPHSEGKEDSPFEAKSQENDDILSYTEAPSAQKEDGLPHNEDNVEKVQDTIELKAESTHESAD